MLTLYHDWTHWVHYERDDADDGTPTLYQHHNDCYAQPHWQLINSNHISGSVRSSRVQRQEFGPTLPRCACNIQSICEELLMLCLTRHPLFDTVTGAWFRLIKSNIARAATLWCGNISQGQSRLLAHIFTIFYRKKSVVKPML